MPDSFGGIEVEDEFGGVAVEEEFTSDERLPRGTTPADFVESPPATFTLGGKEYPLPPQAGRPPMPRSVSEFAGLPAETSRLQDLKETLPSPREFIGDVMEPFSVPFTKLGEDEIQRGMFGKTLPESYQDVLDIAALAGPGPHDLSAPSRPPTEAAKIASGATKAGLGLGETLVSPLAIAAGSASVLPKVAQRLVSAGFSLDMLSQFPEQVRAFSEALVGGDSEQITKTLGDLSVATGFTAGVGFHALRPAPKPIIPPQFVETVRRVDATVPGALNRSLEAAVKKVSAPKVEPVTKGVENAIQEPPATEGVLRQGRPEVGLQEVRQPQAEIVNALPREPARAQGGAQPEVLLTGPEVIKSIVELPDAEAGALRQKPAVEAGMKLTEADVPALEAARDSALKQAVEAAERGDNEAFKAGFGKNIWFAGAIEGARRKGPNYDTFIKEQAAAQPAVATTANPRPIPARQAPVVEPGVGAVPENVSGAGAPAALKKGDSVITDDYGPGVVTAVLPNRVVVKFAEGDGKPFGVAANKVRMAEPAAPARTQPFFERESEAAGLGRSSLPPTVADVRAQRARDVAQTDTIETQPLDPASGAPVTTKLAQNSNKLVGGGQPPGKPPTKPAAAPAPEPARATLDDVYKIFEPAPKEGKGVSQRVGDAVESFRTGFSSKFRPLNKLAEDIAAKVDGKAKDVAGVFEQLKGSSGKAEADVYRFDKDVSDLVKGSEKDFNAYVFLRRSLDRLNQDAADIARAQAGEDVPNLNRRRVSQYTIPQLEAKLTTLSEQIGGEKLAQFDKAAEGFQTHMDQALRLQVESGRMSPEVYDAIKAGNQFYAPFKVMKYIEDTMRPEGSGRKVDTTADFVKAMEGIEDPNFKLGDMLSAARQNLTLSRTLAEKNRAMQNITELAALDVNGDFVQKLKPGQDAPRGMEAVNVMENGVRERYAVNEDVAQAVDNAGPGLPAGIVARWSSNLFRAGATTLNLAFQPVNLFVADAPRAALVSKYGIKGVTDLVRYPMDFVESLLSSIAGDVFGVKNKLFQDFLDSGTAGTTVQQYLTPEALRFKPTTATSKTQAIAKTILNTIPQFANAIEQTSKVLGVKRAMRIEGAESGAALAKQIPEAITEIRRFSGSPDFGRAGKWTDQYRLNLVYMFLNARIQGAVADVGRLTGRDGGSRAAKTWLKMGTAVGIPTAYLYMLNNSDEYKEDYAKRPEQEKQNYWLIPKDTFITGANGEKMRDYWRVPKREIAQWMGNAVESGLDFANQRDPEAFWKWAEGMAESIAPVNIRGNTLQERGESVLSGTHPFIKAPIETATGRDLYRHRAIVPESQKKASPEQQYTDRTAQVFKSLAQAMPDVAPEALRSPLMLENMTKNFTAGLITQFLPGQKPVEGRSAAENLPLAQRFQALPYTDSSEFDQRIQKFERESADEQLKRMRDAKAILDSNKGARPDVLIKQMIEKHGRDPKLAERVVDLYLAEQRGITTQERRVLALPVTQRAEYLADELKGKTPEQKAALLRNWGLKRILTERVATELVPLIEPNP